MDYKFLNKVVDQIVSETQISKRRSQSYILTPFSQRTFSSHEFSQGKDLNSRYSDVKALYHYFSIHCQDIYGLDSSEIDYAFQKYRNIIMLKINGVIESRSKENLNTITESKKGDKKISLSGKEDNNWWSNIITKFAYSISNNYLPNYLDISNNLDSYNLSICSCLRLAHKFNISNNIQQILFV